VFKGAAATAYTAPKEQDVDREESERQQKEIEEAELQFQKQLQTIRSSLQAMIERNNKLPKTEQLAREEFLLDLEVKQKLEDDMQAKLQAVRADINKANCTKRVLFERLKVI
jgi:phosphoenolpyruvate-protein kinase (PTS system EI component)